MTVHTNLCRPVRGRVFQQIPERGADRALAGADSTGPNSIRHARLACKGCLTDGSTLCVMGYIIYHAEAVMVTINCDMGESFGIYTFGDDAACMPYVTHANIACGFHASDPVVMRDTLGKAKAAGIAVGSHPGLPDREGFGRRRMQMRRDEVSALVIYQTGALQALAAAQGVTLSHIKPHGALFGMAQNERHIAEGIADAAEALDLPVIAYSDCCMSEVFAERGVPFTCEFYADLDYDDAGRQIISRGHQSVSPGTVAEKVRRAVRVGETTSINGKSVAVVAESICVHSDTPNALAVAKAVHQVLVEEAMLTAA